VNPRFRGIKRKGTHTLAAMVLEGKCRQKSQVSEEKSDFSRWSLSRRSNLFEIKIQPASLAKVQNLGDTGERGGVREKGGEGGKTSRGMLFNGKAHPLKTRGLLARKQGRTKFTPTEGLKTLERGKQPPRI